MTADDRLVGLMRSSTEVPASGRFRPVSLVGSATDPYPSSQGMTDVRSCNSGVAAFASGATAQPAGLVDARLIRSTAGIPRRDDRQRCISRYSEVFSGLLVRRPVMGLEQLQHRVR